MSLKNMRNESLRGPLPGRRVQRGTKTVRQSDLLQRLQAMLYEFHALGRFEDARPHVLWLMEIAEAADSRMPRPSRPS